MRRLSMVILLAGLGCHHDKYNLSKKFPEEYTAPADEARYNNSDESTYRKPLAKKEFSPAAGLGGPSCVGGPHAGGAGGVSR